MDQKCRKHPQTDATSECRRCGTWVCFLCAVDFRDVTYCSMGCAEKDGAVADMEARRTLFPESTPAPAPSLAESPTLMCVNHAKSIAVAACQKCGNGACMMCAIQNAEGTFCSQECTERGTQMRHRSTVITRAMSKLVGGFKGDRCAAHPKKPSAVVCDSCQRHACDDCKVKAPWGMFCSLECFAWYRDHKARQPLGARRAGRGGRAWVGVLAILVAAGGGVAWARFRPASRPASAASMVPPVVAEAPKVVPPKADPPKPEPPKAEAPRPEPPKVEPPKPEPPKVDPPKPPDPPKSTAHLDLARDPWRAESVGAWYRLWERTPDEERYRDVGLAKREKDQPILVQQLMTAQGPDFEVRFPTDVEELTVVGAMRLMLHGVTHEFDIVQTRLGLGRMWVVNAGRFAGATFQEEWKGRPAVPKRFSDEMLQIRDRKFPCLVIESEIGGTKDLMKVWVTPHYPLGPVRLEVEGLRAEVIDFGPDWSKRPAFPTLRRTDPTPVARVEPSLPSPKPDVPKPEPPKADPPKQEPPREDPKAKVEKSLAAAARFIREATPLYREVSDAAEDVPADPAARRALLEKAEDARAKLFLAKALYEEVKDRTPDPAATGRRVKQLAEVLEILGHSIQKLRGGS